MAIGKNKDNPLKDCPSCNGKGILKCPQCKGKGRPFDCGFCTNLSNNKTWGTVPCSACNGSGKINRV